MFCSPLLLLYITHTLKYTHWQYSEITFDTFSDGSLKCVSKQIPVYSLCIGCSIQNQMQCFLLLTIPPFFQGPGSPHGAAAGGEVAVEEMAERLTQTEQLVSQLKEMIREKDAALRSKDDQLKVRTNSSLSSQGLLSVNRCAD